METTYTESGLSVAKIRKGWIVPAIVEAVRLARAKWPDKQFTVTANEGASTVEVMIAMPIPWGIWG